MGGVIIQLMAITLPILDKAPIFPRRIENVEGKLIHRYLQIFIIIMGLFDSIFWPSSSYGFAIFASLG